MRTAWLFTRQLLLPALLCIAGLYALGFLGLALDQALSEPWSYSMLGGPR